MTSNPAPLEPVGGSDGPPERTRDASLNGEGAAREPSLLLRVGLPLGAIAVGVALYTLLVATRERPVVQAPPIVAPLVRVQPVEPESVRLTVEARGTVRPRTESDLVAEVRGRVLSISPHLVVGGFFAAGDELLRLDDREHRIALDRARATVQLRRSEARLAEADAARGRQLARRGASSDAELEQLEGRSLVAQAALAEALAMRDQAELDLERTIVRAPFDGRVRERSVDVGQFVSPGQKLGRLFAVDYAEVRLPIRTDELAYLEAGVGTAVQGASAGGVEGAEVVLTGRLGGRDQTWAARIDRAEASIDEQTRMFHVVARVDDPYALAPDGALSDAAVERGVEPVATRAARARETGERVPLPTGLFVTAEIAGRALEDVYVLPLMALRDGDRVFLAEPVEAEETAADEASNAAAGAAERGLWARPARLRVRDVRVVRRDRDRVYVDGGLAPGERVIVSPMRVYSESMAIRIVEAEER